MNRPLERGFMKAKKINKNKFIEGSVIQPYLFSPSQFIIYQEEDFFIYIENYEIDTKIINFEDEKEEIELFYPESLEEIHAIIAEYEFIIQMLAFNDLEIPYKTDKVYIDTGTIIEYLSNQINNYAKNIQKYKYIIGQL